MSGTSVGVQFDPSQRPGVTLALDPADPERLLVRSRLGLGRLLFGGLIASFSAYGQLDSWQEEEWAAFTFATLAAWGGVALLTLRRHLVLDRREGVVEVLRGALLPHFRRRESLARFDRVSIILGGQRSSKGVTTTYPVQLEGRDVKVEIDEPGYWEPARDLAEEIAAFLRLPLYDADRSGKLQPHELDRTVGRRGGHVNPVSRPRKLKCRIEEETEDLLRVHIPPPDHRPFLGISVFVGLFLMIPLTGDLFVPLLRGRRIDWLSAGIPVYVLLAVFYASARAVLTNGGLLEVTPGTLRMTTRRPWGARVVAIPASELEDLVILDPEMGGPRTLLAHLTHGVLVARSDCESVRFGYGMSREELAWLRAEIVSVLGAHDKAAPRLTAHPVARRFGGALIGLGLGILAAHLTRGPLTPCIAIPFLQHILSVGAALGLSAGLLMRRLMGPALFAVLVALFLSVGFRERVDFVQERPFLQENPNYLKSSESINNRRYLAGFLPVAALVNLAGLELTLALGERIWRRRRQRANPPPADPRGPDSSS